MRCQHERVRAVLPCRHAAGWCRAMGRPTTATNEGQQSDSCCPQVVAPLVIDIRGNATAKGNPNGRLSSLPPPDPCTFLHISPPCLPRPLHCADKPVLGFFFCVYACEGNKCLGKASVGNEWCCNVAATVVSGVNASEALGGVTQQMLFQKKGCSGSLGAIL